MSICFSLLTALFLILGAFSITGIGQLLATEVQVMDASDVKWAHAVNSKSELEKQLAGSVDFLEADVSLGRLINRPTGPSFPIMAHPPDIISDIALENWLDIVITRSTGKGIKLDFKSIETVEPSLQILQNHGEKINFPLWLNADILPGPKEAPTIPVHAGKFLKSCVEYFPNATLSVGWTTLWLPSVSAEGWYDWPNVREMVDTLRCAGIEPDSAIKLTFPVRAIFASASVPQLQWLLRTFPHSTLTVWSDKFDAVTLDDLLKLRKSFHISRVYYDIPEPLNTEFQESKNNATRKDSDETSSNNWWAISRDKTNMTCYTTTYADNNAVVFAKGVTTAALLKDSFQIGDAKRLVAKGFVRFLVSTNPDMRPMETHELVFALADASLFKKSSNSHMDDKDDTDVIWNALSASRLYTFQHDNIDNSNTCFYFKLDTSQDQMFQVWRFSWRALLRDDSEEEILKNGMPLISKNTKLVLPSGPVIMGFVSSSKMQVVVQGLDISGTVTSKPGTSLATNTAISFTTITLLTSMILLILIL